MTPTNSPDRPSARGDRLRGSLLVFACALALRLLHLWALRGSLLLATLMGDARSYDAWAQRIAGGDWIGQEVFYQAPLYPYFLATLYTLFGRDLLLVRGIQALLGAASCVLLAHAGWRLFGKRAGIAAGLLLAAYAPAIHADTTIQKSVLDLFFLCLALRLLAGLVTRPRPGAALGLGAAVGALVLSRENALVFAAVLAPWLLLRSAPAGARRWAAPALFVAGLALVLGPVALRNLHVGGELHLTTSQLGPNFFIGNNPAADGTYGPLRPGRGDPEFERADATALAEQALGRELGPGEVSAYFLRESLRYIASSPGHWLALMARKLALAFNAVELVDTEDQYTYAESSPVLRLTGWLLHFGVLAPLALLGAWLTGPERRWLLPFHLLFLAYAASLVAFYVVARYRLPLAPFLVLLAAAGVVRVARAVRANGLRRSAPMLAGAAGVAVLSNWPLVDEHYMRSVTAYNLGNELVASGRAGEAIARYRRAIELYPGNALASNNLGVMLAARGDLSGARERYERALAIDPDYADARINLARTLWETGDPSGAIESYEMGLRLDPGRPGVHVELARLLVEVGDLAAAIRSFERALRLDPGLREAQEGLRRARQAQQARREAAAEAEGADLSGRSGAADRAPPASAGSSAP